jgi:lactate dehydrogenase-like 2-hydroxyacid dehydrogenase|tara:strand:+ start:2365 stop:3210 length:846 start_codon:yes stop_codon:yes gene_type:complete
MYQQVLLKDKSDISEVVLQRLPSINVLGAYEKPTLDKDTIKVLSVKFSKVGLKTLTDYKNLEWIICRSHGIDNVNIELAKKRNIGIVATAPTAKPCSNWIHSKLKKDDSILIFGNGAISRELQKKIGNFNVVNSKTSQDEIDRYLKFCKTIIITIPLNAKTKNYFDRTFFSKIKNKVDIISISRGEVFDNGSILDFSVKGKLNNGHFDMLSADGRNVLLEQKSIRYYEHTSWEYNQPKDSHGKLGGYVNVEFADTLKMIVDSCLEDRVEDAHLNRIDNLWF